jgi:hypothetical protein
MSRVSNWTRIVSLTLFAALSCGTLDSPEDVARDFWEAMRVGDRELAATFVTDDSLRLLDEGISPDTMEEILFGEVLRNETAANVRTSMLTRDGDVELNIVFQTHLVLQQNEWKVDLGATQQEVTRATFSAGMKFVGEVIGQGIEEFGQVLEQGAAEVRDAIRNAIEDLGKADGEAL